MSAPASHPAGAPPPAPLPGVTGPLPGVAGPLVLASASPRRRHLLAQLGLEFEVRPPDIDEMPLPGEVPATYVARLAGEKAREVARPGEVVLAADTTVDVDGAILGKPADAAEAAAMLRLLGGRSHVVHTGVAVWRGGRVTGVVVSADVRFAPIDPDLLAWYLATPEPYDKAGAYALQGAGGLFVAEVRGSISGIVGLPLVETLALLRAGHPGD